MRLLTRSDFDGLGCAALLKEKGIIDDIKFVHPKDIQDGKIEVDENDVLANIPYVKGCGLWFDHHSSEMERQAYGQYNGVSIPSALSAARVIYEYYGGEKVFNNSHLNELVKAVDKADSGNFTADEILNPKGWDLLSFVMDPRTGLGRYRDYRISNYQLMMDMIEYCRQKTVDEILEIEDVKERTRRYFEQDTLFKDMVKANTTIKGNVIVLDLRNQEEIYTGNRFILYSLYPEQNVSIQVVWGFQRQNIVMTCGYSVINKSCTTDIGSLMLKHGGGGHKKVGTCQIPVEDADKVLVELIEQMQEKVI
ncbi:MAG: exopolyphosphatase [Desulfamplus sp.]|nr:exopolyphosphatase [Desulfamplus sp.]